LNFGKVILVVCWVPSTALGMTVMFY